MGNWESVPLSQLLTLSEAPITVQDGVTYRQVTVATNGKGLRLRGVADGRIIETKRQFFVRAGQLVFSRIDARNGAIGIVPENLNGAIVTGDFPAFDIDPDQVEPGFLEHYVARPNFAVKCAEASRGVTNRQRLKEDIFLTLKIPLPPMPEQRRVLVLIDELARRVSEACALREAADVEANALLRREVENLAARSDREPMTRVAPIVRRWVDPVDSGVYPELGLRSFGKGTFHKPAIKGTDLNGKRMVEIHEGDLLFSNVFAWEGAIAVAGANDIGRYGSHRYITCVPDPEKATSNFLRHFFLTDEGMRHIRDASPGAAGRNKTLGLKKLEAIPVPVLSKKDREEFERLVTLMGEVRQGSASTVPDLDAIMPSVLDRAFSGRL